MGGPIDDFKEIESFMNLVRTIDTFRDCQSIYDLLGIKDKNASFSELEPVIDKFVGKYSKTTAKKFEYLSKVVSRQEERIKRILKDHKKEYDDYLREKEVEVYPTGSSDSSMSFDKIFETYYEILGVSEDADYTQIKEAYEREFKKTNKSSRDMRKTEARRYELNKAWECLNDPKRKEKYDKGFKKTPPGIPKIEIDNNNFKFDNLRIASSADGSFTISNVGGGALSGTINTNRVWLKVSQNNIDKNRHKQEISFYVDTTDLPFGLTDVGEIEIRSNAINGSTQYIRVKITIEAPEADLVRFRKILVPGGISIGGILGYNIYYMVGLEIASMLGFLILLFAVFIAGYKAHKDGESGFAYGCGTFIGGIIVLLILETWFPLVLSTISWAGAYGLISYIFSDSIRKALWRGDNKIPIAVGIGTIATTIILINIDLSSLDDSKVTTPPRQPPATREEVRPPERTSPRTQVSPPQTSRQQASRQQASRQQTPRTVTRNTAIRSNHYQQASSLGSLIQGDQVTIIDRWSADSPDALVVIRRATLRSTTGSITLHVGSIVYLAADLGNNYLVTYKTDDGEINGEIEVEVVSKVGAQNWYKVRTRDGREGWISSNIIQ